MTSDARKWTYPARLYRVVDGDSLILTVDIGFRMTTQQPFRLLGVNCPENRGVDAVYGKLCTEYVKSYLRENDFFDMPELEITTHKSPDSFGRWLAEVYVDGTDLVNDVLIPQGWGVPWDGKGKNPRPWLSWDQYPNPKGAADAVEDV